MGAGTAQVLVVIWLVTRLVAGSAARRAPKPLRAADEREVPDAAGAVPLLGHALRYKASAPAFLSEQCARVGPVFRINLAGKRMVVVGADRAALAQVATAPEAVLSARRAVQAVGFDEALGEYNVLEGTGFHKQVLKDMLAGPKLVDEVAPLYDALRRALRLELGKARAPGARPAARTPDVLGLVRRCMLRAMIERLLGPALLLEAGASLIDDFMAFQDALEEAIAQASVLPRALSLPLALWPVGWRRRALVARLGAAVGRAREADGHGPWLRAFRAAALPPSACGELVVGLLFAAHKNPAIGAAQAFLLGAEAGGEELRRMRAEGAGLHAEPGAAALRGCEALRRCVLEACRLTAHSIGAVRTVMPPHGFRLVTADGAAYRLRAGETIAVTHVAPNVHAGLWGADAAEYNPLRAQWRAPPADARLAFADTGAAVDEYSFTTFSHGVHKCPGERFALTAMECMLALLVAGPERVEPVPPVPPLCFERATLAQRAGPARVRLAAA